MTVESGPLSGLCCLITGLMIDCKPFKETSEEKLKVTRGNLFLSDIHSRMRGLVQFCSEGRVTKEIRFGSIFL